jgi:branched-subunit amino acid permease
MTTNAKMAWVGMLGLVGLIVLLVPALTHVYPVVIGVIIAIACWIGCGILARYWGVRK